jgi:hypothetical protein
VKILIHNLCIARQEFTVPNQLPLVTVTCPKKERYPKRDTLKFSARRVFLIHDMDLKFHTIQGYAFMYMQVNKILISVVLGLGN